MRDIPNFDTFVKVKPIHKGWSGDKKYYEAAEKVWEYIKEYFIDKRPGSEWFWDLNADGTPRVGRPIVEPWKCPYHNGRMCLEIMNRLADGK